MYSFVALALALSPLASAAALPTGNITNYDRATICGFKSQKTCANSTTANGPLKVVDSQYVQNSFQYSNYPGVLTWSECKAACTKTEGCKSFQHLFNQGDIETGPKWECNLFYKEVMEYITPCSNATENTPLNSFFDLDCEPLPQLITGLIVPEILTSCNTNRTVLDLQTLYRGEMKAANTTQAECKQMCKETKGCKSYFWDKFAAGSYTPRYAPHSHYPLMNGGNTTSIDDLVPNSACITLSQPVADYTVDDGNIFVHEFYDVNCPITN